MSNNFLLLFEKGPKLSITSSSCSEERSLETLQPEHGIGGGKLSDGRRWPKDEEGFSRLRGVLSSCVSKKRGLCGNQDVLTTKKGHEFNGIENFHEQFIFKVSSNVVKKAEPTMEQPR